MLSAVTPPDLRNRRLIKFMGRVVPEIKGDCPGGPLKFSAALTVHRMALEEKLLSYG